MVMGSACAIRNGQSVIGLVKGVRVNFIIFTALKMMITNRDDESTLINGQVVVQNGVIEKRTSSRNLEILLAYYNIC